MKIGIWKTEYDEMPYCVFCRRFVEDKAHYVVNSRDEKDSGNDCTIMSLCSECFDELISLKNEVDRRKKDFEEIYK